MIVSASGHELVSPLGQLLPKDTSVCLDLPDVLLELGCVHLLELSGQGCDLVVVRTTLEHREYGHVDFLRQIPLLREDKTTAGTSQRLVRGRCHNVSVSERIVRLLGSN